VTSNNFSRFDISGPRGDRTLKVMNIDKGGVILSSFQLNEKELKVK
jgi:hypothetical protein